MKRLFLTAQLMCLLSYCFSQEQFTLNGSIKKINPEKVFIEYNSIGVYKIDSSFIRNGKFKFIGTIDGPTITSLSYSFNIQGKSKKKYYSTFFLEKGATEIIQDSNSVVINGSKAQNLYISFQRKFEPFKKESDSIYREYSRIYSQKDTMGMNQITIAKGILDKKTRAIYREEFLNDPASPIAVYLLNIYTNAAFEIDPVDIDTLFAKLPVSVKSTSAWIDLEKKLNPVIFCRIGNIAPEFAQSDTSGVPISLSSFRGKYLLIDFWASWCGPCRKENSSYVSAFKKYSEKGFQILSVSLDNNRNAWIKAIRQDNLCWSNVSDLRFMENAVAIQYGITGIPRNFLIDPTGKIIAKDLRGLDLEMMLGKLLQ